MGASGREMAYVVDVSVVLSVGHRSCGACHLMIHVFAVQAVVAAAGSLCGAHVSGSW